LGEEYSLSDDAVLRAFYTSLAAGTASGVQVTQASSLRCVAVLACLIVRAETFASLPLHIQTAAGGGAETPLPNHWAQRLLAERPNDLMNAGEFWRWKALMEDVTGNAYAHIIRGRGGRPTAIWPLTAQRPILNVVDGQAFYRYVGDDITPPGDYGVDTILHWKGPILRTPFEGASLIDLASEAIGVAIGTEQFFARLLGNGTHFPGYLEKDDALTPEDMAAIQAQLKGYSGLLGAGQVRIFDRGLKYKQNDMSMQDAQLNEQERLQLQKICSIFRVPLAMVADLEHGTYTNSEQQDLWFAKHTITPMCVNTERVLSSRLLDKGVRAKFNLDGLLRGDYKTRSEGDAALVRSGIISRDEARSHYDLNPAPGLEKFLVDLNLGVVGADGAVQPPTAPEPPEPSPAVAAAALLEPLLRDAREGIICRYLHDQEKSRSREESIAASVVKLTPLTQAFALAGQHFDARDFVLATLSGDTPFTLAEEGSET
ncbi:MAG: phage portal protein, partial [Thermoleophilia bacterium]|nr:phage portal protein [Thermoleophilia bacterium]